MSDYRVVANVTELIDADTSGVNAVMLGMASELRCSAILTTQVSAHARRAIREADRARRIMHAARLLNTLPRGMSDELMTVHAKHPFPDTPEEIEQVAKNVRDPNFRVQISPLGLHVYNRDGMRLAQGAFAPGVVDENLLHCRGSGLEKMPKIGVVLIAVAGNLEPRLVHESRGLQRLSGFLIGHADNGQLSQLLIDQRQQLIRGLRFASFDGIEQLRNVGHGGIL